MKEVELVIKISEEIYKRILPYKDCPVISNLANDFPEITYAIANGVPLPKGHGRIGDLDKLEKEIDGGIKAGLMIEGYENYSNINDVDDCLECVKYAPTIIEADRSEEG
jgi:hypothetical protein